MVDRRCLSLTRPWDQVILHGGKRIENRTWPPPPAVIGQHILLHAAKSTEDESGLDFIAHALGERGLMELRKRVLLDGGAGRHTVPVANPSGVIVGARHRLDGLLETEDGGRVL